jgi:O-antigen ligase
MAVNNNIITQTKFIPAIIFTTLSVLIVVAFQVPITYYDQYFYADVAYVIDRRFIAKLAALACCTVAAIIIALHDRSKGLVGQAVAYRYIVPLTIYVVFVWISFAFSEIKSIALWGDYNSSSGVVAISCYAVMCWWIAEMVDGEKRVKYLIYSLAIVAGVNAALGVMQALGIIPSGETGDWVFGHSNHSASYFSLVAPLFASLFITETRVFAKVVWGLLTALFISHIILTGTSMAIFGFAVAAVFGIVLLRKILIKRLLTTIVLVVIIVGSVLMFYSHIDRDVVTLVSGQREGATAGEQAIDYFKTGQDRLTLSYRGKKLICLLKGDTIVFKDGKGKKLPAYNVDGGMAVNDGRFEGLTVSGDASAFGVSAAGEDKVWNFTHTADGVRYVNDEGNLVALSRVPHWGFEGNYDFGTLRGYIWSITLPMLKDRLITGSGADTAKYVIPQNDYVTKYYTDWWPNVYVWHAHNYFLNSAIENGVIAAFALLVFFVVYIIDSIRIFIRRSERDFLGNAGLAILLGIIGFMASSLVHTPGIMQLPLCYGLTGCGIAINRMIKQRGQCVRDAGMR